MQRKFFMNDFEDSLKEQADQFKMIPSKKVWHGIYNDLHPGRRWPSITISLLLVFILVGIGYLNSSNSVQLAAANAKKATISNLIIKNKAISKNQFSQKNQINKKIYQHSNEFKVTNGIISDPNNTSGLTALNAIGQPNKAYQKSLNIFKDGNNESAIFTVPMSVSTEKLFSDANQLYLAQRYNEHIDAVNENLQTYINNEPNGSGNLKNINSSPKVNAEAAFQEPLLNTSGIQKDNQKKIINVDLSNSSPDVVKKSLKIRKKKNEKINWEYYVAPTINTVSFDGHALKPITTSNFSIAMTANQRPNKVLHNANLGFEGGAQMNYMIIHKLQFTSGIHLTYSGYKIISNDVHPTFATLTLKDPSGSEFSKSYITHYGDGTGQTATTLRNYSWQLSLPIGMQYEIGGSDKIRFSAGANIEPSLVLKSNAFILSSDGRNYVNDPSLLRKWNLSSNFGAFMSFRAGKFNWNIGPNMRYQWLSTYQTSYTVKEHLIDYGIRIAISK